LPQRDEPHGDGDLAGLDSTSASPGDLANGGDSQDWLRAGRREYAPPSAPETAGTQGRIANGQHAANAVSPVQHAGAAQPWPTGEALRDVPLPPLEPSVPGESAPPTIAPDDSQVPTSVPMGDYDEAAGEDQGAPLRPGGVPGDVYREPGPPRSYVLEVPWGAIEPPGAMMPVWNATEHQHHGPHVHRRHQGHCDHGGHGPHSSCCGRLPLWKRILRCLCPTHRCIPFRLPRREEGLAGYYPARWNRAGAYIEVVPQSAPPISTPEATSTDAPPADVNAAPPAEEDAAPPEESVETAPPPDGKGSDSNTEMP
jgi:hypothetical protein